MRLTKAKTETKVVGLPESAGYAPAPQMCTGQLGSDSQSGIYMEHSMSRMLSMIQVDMFPCQ